MRIFIKRIALFSLFSVISYTLFLCGVLLLNRLFVKPCLFGDEIETVIAGDSHTMWSIDDRKLNGVRNISLNAEGYLYTYAKLLHLLKQKNRIRKLYIGFSCHNISGYYDDYLFGRQSLLFFNRYIDVLGFKDYFRLIRSNPMNIIKMSPILLREGIWSLFDNRCAFLGSFPEEVMQQTLDHQKVRKRIEEQYYRNGSVIPYSKMNFEFLTKILDLCKKYNIEVIALTTPLQKDYFSLIPYQYIETYERFTREHNLAVYNFRGLELPDSCYLPDGDHVNHNGATAITDYFSKYLAEEKK